MSKTKQNPAPAKKVKALQDIPEVNTNPVSPVPPPQKDEEEPEQTQQPEASEPAYRQMTDDEVMEFIRQFTGRNIPKEVIFPTSAAEQPQNAQPTPEQIAAAAKLLAFINSQQKKTAAQPVKVQAVVIDNDDDDEDDDEFEDDYVWNPSDDWRAVGKAALFVGLVAVGAVIGYALTK